MNIYKTKDIRNVAILGHGGCGKTTLVEALAYVSGITTRMGKVQDGNTISDFDKEEIKRQFSIGTSIIPIEHEGTKINFMDTPGYFDFTGEVEEAMAAAGSAVIVINAKAGVEVGTQKAWELCNKYNLPRLFFVTNMDDDNASYKNVVNTLQVLYGSKIAPFHLPIRENEKFVGFANVVNMKGRRFTELGKYVESDIPEYSMDNLSALREKLMEAVAETNEDFMDRYFSGEEFTYDEIRNALRINIRSCDIVPVLVGSGVEAKGAKNLCEIIEKYFPSPADMYISGVNKETGDYFSADFNCQKPEVTTKVFKTLVDPFIGKYSLIKVCSGILTADTALVNVNKDAEEKIGKLYVLRGKEAMEVSELHAGDIGALAKLSVTQTGDSLCVKNMPVVYPVPELSVPYTCMAYRAKSKGDEDKINSSLGRLAEEDLTLRLENDKENRQLLIYGIGDQHLEIVASKLANRYKVEIELDRPKVAFRETIKGSVKVQGKHKKQSGGHGQYGDVTIEFAPSGDLESAYVFEEKIVGGVVPKNYFPAVEKGIQECVVKGPIAGYPIVGLKATLVFGSYHPVDSSEMAFKMATHIAVKAAFADPASKPVLLEPIATLTVKVPDRFTGDIMGDMNKRRGRVLEMNPDHSGNQIIVGDVPMTELYGYNTALRSMTGGIGSYSYEFNRYEQAPADVQKKEIEARANAKED